MNCIGELGQAQADHECVTLYAEDQMPRRKKKNQDARTGTLWHPVNASPDEIARACLTTPPPERWQYEQTHKTRSQPSSQKRT